MVKHIGDDGLPFLSEEFWNFNHPKMTDNFNNLLCVCESELGILSDPVTEGDQAAKVSNSLVWVWCHGRLTRGT